MERGFLLGQVLAQQMILIVVSGPEISITLKIHFNSSVSDKLRRIKFGELPADDPTAATKVIDYMKELTNRICGQICRTFQRNNVTSGMCIPLNMRGFYELYADYTPNEGIIKKFGHAWRLSGEFGSLVCTAYVEVSDSAAVSNLQHVDETASSDDDELEYL